MERWSSSIVARTHLNMALNTTMLNTTVNETPWLQTNRTQALISKLQLAQVQTLRTMHVTLGGFSLALTLLMVFRILNDAKRASSLQVSLRPKSVGSLPESIHWMLTNRSEDS